MNQSQEISQILQVSEPQIAAVLQLLSSDHTVPFIARYRKEATGNLDEVQILAIERESERWTTLQNRKATVLASLKETENWTAEREKLLAGLKTLTDVEDFYLPFRPKRKTRASIAREAGYQPVADRILANQPPLDAWTEVMEQGGMDIVAEVLAETPQIRALLREGLALHGVLWPANRGGTRARIPTRNTWNTANCW